MVPDFVPFRLNSAQASVRMDSLICQWWFNTEYGPIGVFCSQNGQFIRIRILQKNLCFEETAGQTFMAYFEISNARVKMTAISQMTARLRAKTLQWVRNFGIDSNNDAGRSDFIPLDIRLDMWRAFSKAVCVYASDVYMCRRIRRCTGKYVDARANTSTCMKHV